MPEKFLYADPFGTTGLTLYGVLRQGLSLWNSTTEALDLEATGNRAQCAVPLLDPDGIGRYSEDMPAATAGVYTAEVYNQAGVAPALGDEMIGQYHPLHWNGLAEVSLADLSFGWEGTVLGEYTVYKPGGVVPLPGCTVWVSADEAGEHRSMPLTSDAVGRVRFRFVTPGRVYFWRECPGYVFSDPDVEDVT